MLEEMKDPLSGLHARFIEIDKEHDRVILYRLAIFPISLASGLMWSKQLSMLKIMNGKALMGGFRRYDCIGGKRARYVDFHSLVQSWDYSRIEQDFMSA